MPCSRPSNVAGGCCDVSLLDMEVGDPYWQSTLFSFKVGNTVPFLLWCASIDGHHVKRKKNDQARFTSTVKKRLHEVHIALYGNPKVGLYKGAVSLLDSESKGLLGTNIYPCCSIYS